ncbi:MAG: hypothetical protein ACRDJM_11360 [Actinomycetota bacterium]
MKDLRSFCAFLVLATLGLISATPGIVVAQGASGEVLTQVARFDVPSGWSEYASFTGTVVARSKDDGSRKVPGGPRLTAREAQPDESVVRLLSDVRVNVRGATNSFVKAGPTDVTIAGFSGVSLTIAVRFSTGTVWQEFVTIGNAGNPWILLLEAPAAQWLDSKATLEATLNTLRFVSLVRSSKRRAPVGGVATAGGGAVVVLAGIAMLRRRGPQATA